MKVENRADADHCKVDVKQRHDRSDGVSYHPMVGQNLLRVVICLFLRLKNFPYSVIFFFRWTTSFERKIKSSISPVHRRKATRA